MLFLEKRVKRALDQIRRRASIPLRLELWNGEHFDFSPAPTVTIAVPKASALRYFLAPDLAKLGEAFVEGHIRVKGSLHDAFRASENLARSVASSGHERIHRLLVHTRARDRKAIAHHYDVSNDFYSLFLDSNMVYSCAYFRRADDSLDLAQVRKLDHILDKLLLKPGERLLDIGCGWGALILRAVEKYGATATGITLSRNQWDYVRHEIARRGLADRCSVQLCDYRDLPASAKFDKIASVGMFEHVGLKNLPIYFSKIHALLADEGLVLNHGITTSDVKNRWLGLGAGRFIDRYIFPGGELPHLALVVREIASAGFEIADVESLRRHYARTCAEWADRLDQNREQAGEIAGEKRLRAWQIYLAGCAYGFAHGWMNLYQVLACKSGNHAASPLPMTRDHLYNG